MQYKDIKPLLSSILESYKKKDELDYETGFFLFISIDLVNFTELKNRLEFSKWGKILSAFYAIFKSYDFDNYKSAKVWKLLGDEIVINIPITEFEKIPNILLKTIHAARKFESGVKKSHDEEIKVKITSWIIEAYPESALSTASGKYSDIKNVYFNTAEYSEIDFQDYAGNHMDAGFRLTASTVPDVLSMSVELFYVISEISKQNLNDSTEYINEAKLIANSTKVVGYKKLKGVGNGAPYPILWYSDDWSKIEDLYFSSDYHENEFIRNINTFSEQPTNSSFINYERTYYYKQIIEDSDFIERLKKAKQRNISPLKGQSLPLHIVVLIVARRLDDLFVVMRKRPETKSIYPEKYDFGCTKLGFSDTSLEAAVKKNYLDDFNIEININIEEDQPVASYFIASHNIFGVIYTKLIEVDGNSYSDELFIPLSHALSFSPGDFVPRGLENLKRAVELLDLHF